MSEGAIASRRTIAVVDIDGVLADVRNRLHHISGPHKDWAAFFAEIDQDPVLPEGQKLVTELAAEHHVVYMTGRPEHTRDATAGWLKRHGLPPGRVLMRADDDHRPARDAKLRLVRKIGSWGWPIAVVVDDDPAVCRKLADAGWTARQATWMPRGPALIEAQEAEGST